MDSPIPTSSPGNSSPSKPPVIRRAFTLPTKFSSSAEPRSAHKAEDDIEILYSHPSGRIVGFSPVAVALNLPASVSRKSTVNETEVAGTLPWASRAERTLATGLLQIYRARSSVAFLSSRSILHVIFAKSQCWCVDGETKFVLRIRDNMYYRIELPNTCEDDRKDADAFKDVLSGVLQYEKTPCPFKRGFTVELPEPPTTPIRKRPWRPPERPSAPKTTPSYGSESMDDYVTALSDNGSRASLDDSDSDDDLSDSVELTPRGPTGGRLVEETEEMRTPTRPKALGAARSITAPPQLSLTTIPPSRSHSPLGPREVEEHGNSSMASSVESFQSFPSTVQSFPPSPPDSDASSWQDGLDEDDIVQKLRRHRTDKRSKKTASTKGLAPALRISTGTALHPDGSEFEPLGMTERRKSSRTGSRAPSPLPPSANIFIPSESSDHHLTTAILQKSCSLMMITPAQLIRLMLSIARKIAEGALHGVVIGQGKGGRRIPCEWECSEDEAAKSDEDDVWSEDDYGVPLGRIDGDALRRRDVGRSWEIT